jgi:hypothetical protein
VVQILFGVTNDAPGVVIGPDGVPHHVPGGPGDPVWKQLSSASRDVLIGLAVGELGSMVSHAETRVGIQKMSTHLLNMNGGNVFSRNLDAEGRLR